MHECTGRIRRFRFNLPQRIAAVFLAFFLFQGMWLLSRNPDGAEAAAACGRALWLHPLTVNSPACSAMQAGPLVYRLAILPLMVHLPFLAIAFVMGGALWWVTRRQYGNLGGYTALAFCCFSPVLLRKIIQPDGGIPGTLGVYAGIYTMIGVAHAMQGPRSKWRPRIILLTVILAATASTSLPALFLTLVMGLSFMLWVAEGRRRAILPVVAAALGVALLAALVCDNFSLSLLIASCKPTGGFSVDQFCTFVGENPGFALALLPALALYLFSRRTCYFGNTAPLLMALALLCASMLPGCSQGRLWALPFLFTFVGGVFADGYEGKHGKLWKTLAIFLLLQQVISCLRAL